MVDASICDVCVTTARRERDACEYLVSTSDLIRWDAKLTVGKYKVVCNNGYSSSGIVESVDLISQSGDRSEVLEIAVQCVGEVDILVSWVDRDIIQRVELPSEIIVDEN